MSPSRFQYAAAHTVGIVTGASSLLFAVFVGRNAEFSSESLASMFWLVCAILIALPVGWLLGFLGLCFCGPLIFPYIAKINGAPFRAGDWVRVLSGSHRDRIVNVYDVWEERGEVRVELDEQAKRDFNDVFSYIEICRVRDAPRRFEADHHDMPDDDPK